MSNFRTYKTQAEAERAVHRGCAFCSHRNEPVTVFELMPGGWVTAHIGCEPRFHGETASRLRALSQGKGFARSRQLEHQRRREEQAYLDHIIAQMEQTEPRTAEQIAYLREQEAGRERMRREQAARNAKKNQTASGL